MSHFEFVGRGTRDHTICPLYFVLLIDFVGRWLIFLDITKKILWIHRFGLSVHISMPRRIWNACVQLYNALVTSATPIICPQIELAHWLDAVYLIQIDALKASCRSCLRHAYNIWIQICVKEEGFGYVSSKLWFQNEDCFRLQGEIFGDILVTQENLNLLRWETFDGNWVVFECRNSLTLMKSCSNELWVWINQLNGSILPVIYSCRMRTKQ